MDIRACLNRCYQNMTICDLRLMNEDAEEKLSHHSVMFLELISCQESCTVSSLSELLHISKPAVTKKVNELIRRGLVVKTQSEEDRRVFYLRVSDPVEAVNARYDRPFARAARTLEEEFTPEELATFCQILDRFSTEFMKEELP